MQFFPKEICERLEKMGCVSESLVYHGLTPAYPEGKLLFSKDYTEGYLCPHNNALMAFTPWDFLGTSEQARKNAEILWPSDISGVALRVDENVQGYFFTKGLNAGMKPSVFHRHEAIDSPDAMEYIMRFVKWKN